MYKAAAIAVMLLLTTSCTSLTGAALESVSPFKEEKGITATAQVGQNNINESSKSLATISNKQDFETTNNASVVNQTYETIPVSVLVVFAVFAAFVLLILPSPFDPKRRRYNALADKLVSKLEDDATNVNQRKTS